MTVAPLLDRDPPPPPLILEECLVANLDEDLYHADPVPSGSLSQSGARYLLPPYTPAHFDHYRRHPRPASRSQELGSAVHTELLGTGVGVEVHPSADEDHPENEVADYSRKPDQEWRKKVRAAGKIPLLGWERRAVTAMVEQVRRHRTAGPLLTPSQGIAEASFFWIDDETGVWRRGRTDFVHGVTISGGNLRFVGDRVFVVDYKSSSKPADPSVFARATWDYYYFLQDPWYVDGIQAVCGLDEPPEFVWVVQETFAPFLVNVFYLDRDDEAWGRKCARAALRRYADCVEADMWEGHPLQPQKIELPRWGHNALRDWERDGLFYDRRYDQQTLPAGGLPVYDDTYRGW